MVWESHFEMLNEHLLLESGFDMTMAGPLVQGDKHGRRPVVNAWLSGSAMNAKTISICRPIVSHEQTHFCTLQMREDT